MSRLDVEPEAHDVAVLDDVVRPFEAHAAGVACAHLAAIGGEIGIGDRFRADKAFLEVGVDLAGCLRRLVPSSIVQACASFGPTPKKVTSRNSA